jgi:hypothetical protein
MTKKTISMVEVAETTLGLQWPYTEAEIENARQQHIRQVVNGSHPSGLSEELVNSAVTQCLNRVEQEQHGKPTKPTRRSTRTAPQGTAPDLLDKNFWAMSEPYFDGVVESSKQKCMALAVLGLELPSTQEKIKEARKSIEQAIDPSDVHRLRIAKALAVAEAVLLRTLGTKKRAKTKAANTPSRLSLPNDHNVSVAPAATAPEASPDLLDVTAPTAAHTEGTTDSALDVLGEQGASGEEPSEQSTRTVESAFDEARSAVIGFLEKDDRTQIKRDDDAFVTLARVLEVHEAGLRDPDRYRQFLKSRGIKNGGKGRTANNEYHVTVKAMFDRSQWIAEKHRISRWGRMLAAASSRQVRSDGFVAWCYKCETVRGWDGLKGFEKGLAIYAENQDQASDESTDVPSEEESMADAAERIAEAQALPTVILKEGTLLDEIPDGTFGIAYVDKQDGEVKISFLAENEVGVQQHLKLAQSSKNMKARKPDTRR